MTQTTSPQWWKRSGARPIVGVAAIALAAGLIGGALSGIALTRNAPAPNTCDTVSVASTSPAGIDGWSASPA